MASPRYLLLDRGNTRLKWCLRTADTVLDSGAFPAADLSRLAVLGSAVDHVFVASVAGEEENARLREALGDAGVSAWFARSRTRCGDLVNSYREPEKMGVDRWLAMLAAREEVRGPCCVVDAGSALTIDLVAADGQHEGGYIIPGLALMQRALISDTQRVRFDPVDGASLAPGRSTAEAVVHGAMLALVGAVDRALDTAAEGSAVGTFARRTLITGGSATAIAPLLRCAVELRESLVLDGLWLAAVHERTSPAGQL